MNFMQKDRESAIMWARLLLASSANVVILDTETTGLGPDAEIVQIAMTDLDGITHLNSLVKPVYPIPSDATKIHGITNEMVANAPAWPVVCMRMMRVLAIRPILVIYNEQYDLRLINQSSQKHDMSVTIAHPKNCAMLQYSAYVGDWNYSRCSYRWQKLTGGDYSAKGDCIATAALIRRMAETKLSEE